MDTIDSNYFFSPWEFVPNYILTLNMAEKNSEGSIIFLLPSDFIFTWMSKDEWNRVYIWPLHQIFLDTEWISVSMFFYFSFHNRQNYWKMVLSCSFLLHCGFSRDFYRTVKENVIF